MPDTARIWRVRSPDIERMREIMARHITTNLERKVGRETQAWELSVLLATPVSQSTAREIFGSGVDVWSRISEGAGDTDGCEPGEGTDGCEPGEGAGDTDGCETGEGAGDTASCEIGESYVRALIRGGLSDALIQHECGEGWPIEAIRALRLSLIRPRAPGVAVRVHWLYGPPGSGKVLGLAGADPLDECVMIGGRLVGYTGRPRLVLDVTRGDPSAGDLLALFSGSEVVVPGARARVNFCATRIYVLSREPPSILYRDSPNLADMVSAIDHIEEFSIF